MTSLWPSPLKSPTGMTRLYMFQPHPILYGELSGPEAVPGYSHRLPSDNRTMTSEDASEFQVPAVKAIVKLLNPLAITLADFPARSPVPGVHPQRPRTGHDRENVCLPVAIEITGLRRCGGPVGRDEP